MSKKAMEDGSYIAMNRCYFCGKEKDIIIDRRFKDISEIHNKVTDTEPCNECEEFMKQGIIVISIRDGEVPEGNPPNPYRTGGFWVMKQEAMERMFPDFDWNKWRFTFMEDSACEKIGLHKPKPDG